jgi:hypothetical protein
MQNLGLGVTISSDVAGAIAGLNSVSQEFERMGAEAVGALNQANQAITDLNSGTVNINRLTQALQVFRTAAFNTTDNEKLQEYNRNVQLLEQEIQRLSVAGRSAGTSVAEIAAAAARLSQARDSVNALGTSVQSINQMTSAISTFRQAIAASTNPIQIREFNRSIQLLEVDINRLSSSGRLSAETLQRSAIAAGQLSNSSTNASGKMVLLSNTVSQTNYNLAAFRSAATRGVLSYNQLGQAAQNAGRATTSIGASANKAGYQLTNLGRFASDLPFGFIAIQNNIGPLIEGFQSLVKATGSTGAALRALGKSFLGGSGILVAFQVVSALMTTLIQKYGSFGNAVDQLNVFTSDATKTTIRFNNALAEGGKQAQGEIVHTELLYRSTQNLSLSMKDRLAIADHLIKQFPQTFSNYTAEAIVVGKAADAYSKLKDQIVATAQIKSVEDAIGKQGAEIFPLRQKELKLTQERATLLKDIQERSKGFFGLDPVVAAKKLLDKDNEIKGVQGQILRINRDINQTYGDAEKIITGFGKTVLKVGDDSDKLKTIPEIIKTLNQELTGANNKIQFFGKDSQKISSEKITALNKAFEDISKVGGPLANEELKKISAQILQLEGAVSGFKEGDKISKVMQNMKNDLQAADAQAEATGLSFDNLATAKITILRKAFDELIRLGISPTSSQVRLISDDINNLSEKIIGGVPIATRHIQFLGKALQVLKTQGNSGSDIAKILGQSATPNPLFTSSSSAVNDVSQMVVILDDMDKGILHASEAWTKFRQNVSDTKVVLQNKNFKDSVEEFRGVAGELVKDLKVNLVAGFAEGIAAFASGTTNLAGFLGGMLSIVGDFAISLGKAAIPIGFAAAAIKKAFTTPGGAIAAGAGLILVGGLIKGFASKLNKGPAMYTGGMVEGPQQITAGDNPGRREAIIPSELFGKIGGTPQQMLKAYLAYDRLELKLENVRKNRGR